MNRVFATLCIFFGLASGLLAQEDHLSLLRSKTESQIRENLDALHGSTGIAVLDLTTGERFAFRDSAVFPQASAIKVTLLMEVYRQTAEKRFSLRDRLPVTKTAIVGGSGILQLFGDSTSALGIRDLCMLMMTQSDNTATNMLIDLVGMKNVNAMLTSLGLRHTKLQRKMMDLAASARGEENISTPAEALHVMELLYRREFVSRAACDDMLALLRLPKRGGFRAGVPDSVSVACKSGGLPGVATEWALILLPERPFAVVFMENYAVGAEADAAMKEIGRILFDYFWRKANATKFGTYVPPALKKEMR